MLSLPNFPLVQATIARASLAKGAVLAGSDIRVLLSGSFLDAYKADVEAAKAAAEVAKEETPSLSPEGTFYWSAVQAFYRQAFKVARMKGDAKKLGVREADRLADIARNLWQDVPESDRVNFRELSATDAEDDGFVPGLVIVQVSKKSGAKANKRVRVRVGQDYELAILKTEFDVCPEHRLVPWQQQCDALDRYIKVLTPLPA